jgi:hypothetical protein
MQRKIARKKASETSNQEESTEVVIFNGHAATSSVKETSPETSVPGTESESSPIELSPNIGAQLIDSQNILKSILGLNRSTSTQPANNPISMSQEELAQQSIASSTQFKQIHSYFSTGLSIEQSQAVPAQMKHSAVDVHSATVLPYHNFQTPNSIYSEELNVNHSQKNFLKSASQTPIQNKHNHDITAPIPIHANTNVAIAALDPEQKLRRNSLLSLFAASTSARTSSSDTPAPSITVEYDTQRKNSLLSVLQPETSVIASSKNLTHDDIVQHQLQQSKVPCFPDSYDTIKSSNDHIRNDMFQHHVNQNIPQNDNPVIMNPLSETILNSTFIRNSAHNEDHKISSNIGHIGQGRPSSNNDDSNENHEVARKMSLLGLFSTASNSGNANTLLHANHESLLRLIKSSPSPQSKHTSPKITASDVLSNTSTKTALSQDYERETDEKNDKNNSFTDDYTRNDIDSHVLTNHYYVSPDLRVRYELLDRIHSFIPPDGTKSQENDLCHADKNPMNNFKFDLEKIDLH